MTASATTIAAPTPDDLLERAKRAADRGDVSHTVLYSQEALLLVVQSLAVEVRALRKKQNVALNA